MSSESGDGLDVVVVGAGIGGLATAAFLRRAGHRVTVLEQARHILPVGAGIQLAPNATAILGRLGALDLLAGRAVAAEVSIRRRYEDGRTLGEYRLGAVVRDRFGAPYLHALRSDLHWVLASVALGDDHEGTPARLVLGKAVVGIEQRCGGPATVVTSDDDRIAADAVIGADGIHSQVRNQIAGPENVRYSGDVAYRFLVPRQALRDDERLGRLAERPSLTIWLGPGCHLVHYLVRGGDYLNVVLVASGDEPVAESWSTLGEPSEAARLIEGWDERALALVLAARSAHRTGLFDRDPLDRWTDGRVALLGDACHPMLPYQAQGAAQALEDAEVLGDELDGVRAGDVEGALAAYAEARRTRAAAVQQASRFNRTLFHLPDGPEQQERDEALANMSGDFDSYAWLWGNGARAGGKDTP